MDKKEVIIGDLAECHENPIAELVQLACRYSGNIYLNFENHQINAKSIMGVMAFNPANGKKVTLEADGSDAQDALDAMEKFLACC